MSELGTDLCCPLCGNIQDSYELFVEGGSEEGVSTCLYCHEPVPDEEWIQD